ncbi:MAG: hypothetical protein NC299_09200 [Lachnospiraceae bacterium]|nr:hypothetical protein [Ruminococcus sp.]MCM1275529.1 hypothetical protein [Lachnospiraceae bacterium]
MKFVRFLIIFVMLAFLGIALLVATIKDKAELAKPRGDLETMKASDFYNGRFVEGEIYDIWDNYAYLEESDTIFGISYNTKTTAQYYAMPLPSSYDEEELKFVALSIRDAATQKTANRVVEETADYLDGKELPEWTTLNVTGKVTKLSGEGLGLFRSYISKMGGGEENIVAYVINVGNDGGGSTGVMILAIVLTVIGLGGSVFLIIRRVLAGSY